MGPTFFKMRALYLSLHACMANFPNGALARRPFRGRRPYEQGYGSLLPWGEEKTTDFVTRHCSKIRWLSMIQKASAHLRPFNPLKGSLSHVSIRAGIHTCSCRAMLAQPCNGHYLEMNGQETYSHLLLRTSQTHLVGVLCKFVF